MPSGLRPDVPTAKAVPLVVCYNSVVVADKRRQTCCLQIGDISQNIYSFVLNR